MSNQIQAVLSQAHPDLAHGWTMTTAQLAEGYGVSPTTLRGNKRNNSDELKEGHHWLKDEQGNTQWTKAGAIRMGMFVKSERAVQFRDMAEALVVDAMNKGTVQDLNAPALPAPSSSMLDSTAAAIADVVVGHLSAEEILQERVNHHIQAKLDAQVSTVDPANLGEALALQWGLSSMVSLTESIANLTNAQGVSA